MTTLSSAEIASQIKKLLFEITDERADAIRLDELRRLFATLYQQGEFDLPPTTPTQTKWRAFLNKSHKAMMEQLIVRVKQGQRTAIRTMWGVVVSSPQITPRAKILDTELIMQWIRALATLPFMDKSIIHMLQMEFLGPYRDAQYYSMIAIANVAREIYESGQAEAAERILQILCMIDIAKSSDDLKSGFILPPDHSNGEDWSESSSEEDDENSEEDESVEDDASEQPRKKQKTEKSNREKLFSFQRIKAHRKVWSEAWMAVLRLPLPLPCLKMALQYLPANVLPNVSKPLRFSDFFIGAYSHSGVVPVLALDGLFILMTEHGLEYPDYYKQLYQLVTPSLFYVKYRVSFFRLLAKSLTRNDMLPANLVAAFCKRILRCSAQAPPSSILFALALVSNLLRKHPETNCLIHRDGEMMDDKYDNKAEDPKQACALQSSLWELGVLSRHYHPSVVTLAKSIGREEELKTPLHNLDDFLSHTYKSLFEQERKRRQKGKTALTFENPEFLFVDGDVFECINMNGIY